MNSRASKFLMSLPFLKLSSSSKTVIGMATSCSAKFMIESCEYMITDVSITKIFFPVVFEVIAISYGVNFIEK